MFLSQKLSRGFLDSFFISLKLDEILPLYVMFRYFEYSAEKREYKDVARV
jgi:hypothetical protein